MPELPEVEIVCRNLAEMIPSHSKISSWMFFRSNLRTKIPKLALKKLQGKPLLGIQRRAKYILFDFGDKIMISHLGMTGSWREEKKNWIKKAHDHLAFEIENSRFFVYQDPRRFGFVEVINTKDLLKRFSILGLEPLDSQSDFNILTEKFLKLKTPIKSSLMNQKYIVGVGNIYAAEALFAAQIAPFKKCSKITPEKYNKLWFQVKKILIDAISKGGSTIENYRNSFGEEGGFQKDFFVYGRENESCFVCGTPIRQKNLAGRSTFWCPSCQN